MKRGATKEEIIRITQELITRNGIRAVRVDEIAQMLGISRSYVSRIEKKAIEKLRQEIG